MFGLGITEILFILLIAVIILGPEHAPRTARMLGKWSGKMRSAASSFSQAVNQDESLKEIKECIQDARSEFNAAADEIKKIGTDVDKMHRDVADDINAQTHSAFEDAKKSMSDMLATTGRTDFMSKPLGRLCELDDSPLRDIWLAPPAQVPDAIREKTLLIVEHFKTPMPPLEFEHIPLVPRKSGIAFCQIRALDPPASGQPEALKMVKLDAPTHNNEQ